jgi:hypothetical protein
MRSAQRTVTVLAVMFTTMLVGLATAQKPEELAGKWTGKVTADIGEMTIVATLKVKDGVVSGEIQTEHGISKVGKVELKDKKWVIPFTAETGETGTMTGTVSGDTFEGEWDHRPMALGTFTLKRLPKA